MVRIKKSNLIQKANSFNFKKQLIKYVKTDKCCNEIVCDHPKHQSDPFVHNKFKVFKKSVKEELRLEIDKMWVYYVKKGETIEPSWHTHGHGISCLLYITDNDLGTKFKNFDLELMKNYWIIWDKDIEHTPEPGYNKKDRIVIAGKLYENI